MYQGEKEQMRTAARVPGRVLMGGGIALAVSIVCLIAASAGIALGWLTEGSMQQLTAAACAVGAFAGGGVTVGVQTRRRTLCGACVGLALFAFLALIGTVLYDGIEADKNGAILLAACLCGGALSGALPRRRTGKGRAAGERKRRRRK